MLHSLVTRYQAEKGGPKKVKDLLAHHRAFPCFAQLSEVTDKPSHEQAS